MAILSLVINILLAYLRHFRVTGDLEAGLSDRSHRLNDIEDELTRVESLLATRRHADVTQRQDGNSTGDVIERLRVLGVELANRERDKQELADALSRCVDVTLPNNPSYLTFL